MENFCLGLNVLNSQWMAYLTPEVWAYTAKLIANSNITVTS